MSDVDSVLRTCVIKRVLLIQSGGPVLRGQHRQSRLPETDRWNLPRVGL